MNKQTAASIGGSQLTVILLPFPQDIQQHLKTVWVVIAVGRGDATGVQWVKVRNAINASYNPSIALHNKVYPAQNVSTATVNKPYVDTNFEKDSWLPQ